MSLPSVGTRFSVSGSIGTVRYVGPVDGSSGVWLGVEWDDPKRGRHDGTKDGKAYFTCRGGPTAASFIRPSSQISYGRSFLKALVSKYIELPHGSAFQEKVLLGSSNGTIEVEAVGLDKVRGKFANLQKLREISLDNELVAEGNLTGQINKTCPSVRGLDLSVSLLPSWNEVALITAELPLLERLALNRNRFLPPPCPSIFLAFSNLTDLQINGTLMSWAEIETIMHTMPNLRLCEVGFNELTLLSSPDHLLAAIDSAVQIINLDSNKCRDWPQICRVLERHSSLQRLILTANRIETIPKFNRSHHSQLPGLKHLSLTFNCLQDWSDIDSLARWCPALENLSLAGNPLTSDYPADRARYVRQFTIARLPSLLALDAAPISPKERRDCELFYISHVANNSPMVGQDELRKEHPRWDELCAKHGGPDLPERRRDDRLSSRLIQINIEQRAAQLGSDSSTAMAGTTASRKIAMQALPTMTLRTLRLKIKKTMRLVTTKASVALRLKMKDGTLVGLESSSDDRDLAWLGVEDGTELVVDILQ